MAALLTVPRALFVALGVPLVTLGACGGGNLGGSGGAGVIVVGDSDGAGVGGSGAASAGGAGGGGGAGGAPGEDAGTACMDQGGILSWQLTPAAAALSGMVVRKIPGSDGAQELAIVNDTGVEYILALRAPAPAPIAIGQRIDLRTAEIRAFVIQRTLEIRRDGDPVLYVTEAEQPNLPPPMQLEIGDVSCPWGLGSLTVTNHRLVAHYAGLAVTIDAGQQVRVGLFQVYNDRILRFPPGVDDATDQFRVSVIRDP